MQLKFLAHGEGQQKAETSYATTEPVENEKLPQPKERMAVRRNRQYTYEPPEHEHEQTWFGRVHSSGANAVGGMLHARAHS